MKPVITKDEETHYVSESNMIIFIEANSNYGWDKICDLVREDMFNEDGKTYYSGKIKKDKYHTEFQVE